MLFIFVAFVNDRCLLFRQIYNLIFVLISFHQEVRWHKAKAVEAAQAAFEMQPLEGLCYKCGVWIFSHANMDPKELIAKVKASRVEKAKCLLGHQILDGTVPKGFSGAVVRSRHVTGIENSAERAGVTKTDFFDAFFQDPTTRDQAKIKKIDERPIEWTDGEGNVKEGFLMRLDDDDLKKVNYTVLKVFFNKNEQELLEHPTVVIKLVRSE